MKGRSQYGRRSALPWFTGLCAAAFIFFAVAGYLFAAQSEQSLPSNRVNGGAVQHPSEAVAPRSSQATPVAIASPIIEARTEARTEEAQGAGQGIAAWLTDHTFLVGLLQVIAIGFQVFIARRQNAIADVQRGITQAQLDTTRALERAYVSFGNEQIVTKDDLFDKAPRALKIQVTNHGRSPATILGGQLRLVVTANGSPNDHPTQVSGLGRSMLMSKAAVDITLEPIQLTDEQWAGIRLGSSLWVVGCLRYSDIFSDSFEAGFCRRFDPVKGQLVQDQTTMLLNYDRPASEAQPFATELCP